MGCDIHMTVEVRRNGKWERAECPPRPCSMCYGTAKAHDGRPCYWCHSRAMRKVGRETPGVDVTAYHDRNYTVFAVLADVRNDGEVEPICEPRGLPTDMCLAAPRINEDGDDEESYEFGDHSFSWLTVAEVLAYPWDQDQRDEGWVDAEQFAEWEARGGIGNPKGWCASVGGGGVSHVSNGEMRRRIKSPHPWERWDSPYTLIQWTVRTSEYAKHFLAFVDSLAPLGEPSDVRLVFGFDS